MKVTDDLPGKNQPIDEEQLKATLLAQHKQTEVKKSDFPTEVIDLPSKGLLYPEGHPLSGGTIEMKYMTAKEEDILASANLIKQGVVIDKLLEAMIITPVSYKDLLVGDKNAIMIAARVLGYGKDYNVEVACGHCSEKNKVSVDLTAVSDKEVDETLLTPHQNIFTYTLPKSGRTIQFQLLTHGLEQAITEELKGLKKVTARTGIDKELSTRLKYVIVSVDGDDSKQAVRNFVDNELFAIDSRAFREYVKDIQPDVDLSFEYSCSECMEHNDKVDIPIDVEFFWPRS